MSSKFKAPSIDRLKEVDRADCEYAADLVEIEGVVSQSAQGGWPHSDEYSVHCIDFSAWRRPGQPMVSKKLSVLRPVDPEGDWFSAYPNLSIHRIQVLLSKDESRAIFAAKSRQQPDTSGLSAVVEELQKPVVVKSQRFGLLTLDRSIGWFTGETEWNGRSVRITCHADMNQDITQTLAVAERLWNDQQVWKQRVDDYAVLELLPIKNDNWLNDDESPLNEDLFKSRMTLESISIHPDGNFDFWHDDGDLFWGHSIQISGSLTDGLTNADIPG